MTHVTQRDRASYPWKSNDGPRKRYWDHDQSDEYDFGTLTRHDHLHIPSDLAGSSLVSCYSYYPAYDLSYNFHLASRRVEDLSSTI